MDIQFNLPAIEMPKLPLPMSVKEVLDEVGRKLVHRPKLHQQFLNCLPNTLETTAKLMEDGSTFIITGDIPAMWLRDSVEQVFQYIPLCNKDPQLSRIILGLIRRHVQCILHDPYANAFNESSNGNHWDVNDQTDMSDWVWERKFELDSVCFSVRLAYHYWKATCDAELFDKDFKEAMQRIARLFAVEQHHTEKSPYRFTRTNCPAIDTLHNDGMGTQVVYTGMIWSGFRPSDDACEYHYHIPGNMMAVVALRQMQEMAGTYGAQESFLEELQELEDTVEQGIRSFGITQHPEFGLIYAYETDGLGHYCLLDDAGTPGLMSIPYIGYASADDSIYLNTRRFILSQENPYYYEGQKAKGIGSPHTPPNYIWPMALSMQGLTATEDSELLAMLNMLESTDADTGFMHEGFHADNPFEFTRAWFAWSNSLFSQLVLKALSKELLQRTR